MVLHEMNADLLVLQGRLQVAAMKLDPAQPGAKDIRDASEIVQSLCSAVRGLWLQSSSQEKVDLHELARRAIQSVAGNGRILVVIRGDTASGSYWRAERVMANMLRNALSASETASLTLSSTWNKKPGILAEASNIPTHRQCTTLVKPSEAPPHAEVAPRGLGLRLCKTLTEEVGGSFDLRVAPSGEYIATAWLPSSQTG